MSTAPSRLGLVQITLTAMLWGTTGVVVQRLHNDAGLSAVTIAFYRLATAAVVLLAFAAWRRPASPRPQALRSLVAVGAGLAVYQLLYFSAVLDAGVSTATIVSLGLAPVLTAAWEAARARLAPRLPAVAVLLAGITGLVLVAGSPNTTAPRPLLGLLAATGSGIGYAASTVLSRHLSRRLDAVVLTTGSTVVGAVLLLPFALVSGIGLPAGAAVLFAVGYLGVATTALAYGLFYAGLRTVPGSTAALLTLLEPLTVAALAVLLLGEVLRPPAVVGAVLLLGSVMALYLRPQARPAGTDP